MFDVALPADGRMMVRQRHIGGLRHLLHEHAIGVVLAAFEFVAHDGHLRLPVAFAQPQMAHAVRFDCDVPLEVRPADGCEIIGAVEGGAGIELAADAPEELFHAVALGIVEGIAALEHQVLEYVRGPRRARHLVA